MAPSDQFPNLSLANWKLSPIVKGSRANYNHQKVSLLAKVNRLHCCTVANIQTSDALDTQLQNSLLLQFLLIGHTCKRHMKYVLPLKKMSKKNSCALMEYSKAARRHVQKNVPLCLNFFLAYNSSICGT